MQPQSQESLASRVRSVFEHTTVEPDFYGSAKEYAEAIVALDMPGLSREERRQAIAMIAEMVGNA